MPRDNWLGKAIVTIIVLGLVAWFVQNGISNRPIIGYKLEKCPNEIAFSYNEDTKELSTKLGISNSGGTGASVILHFYGQNIEIANKTKQPYNSINDTNVYIRFTTSKNSQEYYFGETVYFTIQKEIDSFSYSYEVVKKKDVSISGGINKAFGEIKGFYPTLCEYEKESENKFIYVY